METRATYLNHIWILEICILIEIWKSSVFEFDLAELYFVFDLQMCIWTQPW